eukprot:TRINITY_DN4936_c0_g1_i11.p3 TRINITY_DN4936_c0_g1~~TRINITY_DN4936_c0_g1_i11.p3  ORF type:complete len:211 (-),score=19.87 TRINITY_DN4936_c0_g1_i11:270-902(-)
MGQSFACLKDSLNYWYQQYSTKADDGTKQREVYFVLGGPGSGKGTQCSKIVTEFGIAHFSAGDLLRAHVKSGTPDGNMVAQMMQEGKIVPSEVTIGLLRKAMDESGKTRFLIDGFPRNMENRDSYERVIGCDCNLVIFFDCPEEVMESRLSGRNEGRADDNIETIRKRFKTYQESTMPVINFYEKLNKIKRIIADRSVEEVYEEVRTIFV